MIGHTTGGPTVLWEFVLEIKSLCGIYNLHEISELKAVKAIDKLNPHVPFLE